LWHAATRLLAPLADRGVIPRHIPLQLKDLAGAEDTDILQDLFTYLRNQEHAEIFNSPMCFPFAGCSNDSGLIHSRPVDRDWTGFQPTPRKSMFD
jgi:hypothetical protein